ncbi:MAG: lipocalin family protein [Prevotella sp.]|nr:lipocalin family protein [Prevotella sp.]
MAALFLIIACGGGDDDGRRLGETIIGTWQRGEVIIDGEPDLNPEDINLDKFVFRADGDYNGMVRKGSFVTMDAEDKTVLEGNYKCDNSTLRLESSQQVIVAQVMAFTDDTIQLRYVLESYHVTISLTLRKVSN